MFASNLETEEMIALSMLENAIKLGASDIKIDTGNGTDISFKIEGKMSAFTHVPKTISPYFITYIQKISGLNVGNLEKEEDSSFHLDEYNCSFRVSQIHKSYGDIVIVMRLLKQNKINSLDKLNLHTSFVTDLRQSLLKKEGLIILSGPTDSGKTTTICAAIKELENRSLNIVSIEDPIEYRLNGVSQVQITERLGFDKIMRQFLRLNPDIIFLGEIRDKKSAHLCIEASRTGHLVISTIHANSPNSIKKRFTDDFLVKAFDYDEFLLLASTQKLIRNKNGKRFPYVNYIMGQKCL